MTLPRVIIFVAPIVLILVSSIALTGHEGAITGLGKAPSAKLFLGQCATALPYVVAGLIAVLYLFAAAGTGSIRVSARGVATGTMVVVAIAIVKETTRLARFSDRIPLGQSIWNYLDPATMIGAAIVALGCAFALRVSFEGNAAFASVAPRRIRGKRAVHGDADSDRARPLAARLFPETGGIVVGEAYRVDRDSVSTTIFRANDPASWGTGGRASLLCFDGSFGSSHGIVFAGSGGYKTTSVTIPTALKWGSTLVALDPSKRSGADSHQTARSRRAQGPCS